MIEHAYSDRDLSYVHCDLCGRDAPVELFKKDGFRHVECSHCDLIYVNPRLRNPVRHQEDFYDHLVVSSDDFNKLARQDYTGSRKIRHMKEAAEYLPYNLNGRILDVGCGFGGFLKGAAEQGWRYPEGIEVAPQAIEYTSRFFPVKTKPFEEAEQTDYLFDVIRLHNVIEHVRSPRAVIRTVYKNLRSGGLLVINTPNYHSISSTLCRDKWHYIGGDDHIYLFTPKTISHLLSKNGFKIVNMETKGTHITPKNHAKNTLHQDNLFDFQIKLVERILDLFVRRTLWGSRLKVLAEKR